VTASDEKIKPDCHAVRSYRIDLAWPNEAGHPVCCLSCFLVVLRRRASTRQKACRVISMPCGEALSSVRGVVAKPNVGCSISPNLSSSLGSARLTAAHTQRPTPV
jgi:hypothetical protein